MSNCTGLGELHNIVPTNEDAIVSIDSAPQVAIQSLPILFGLVMWTILECAHRKRAASDRVRHVVRMFTFFCTITISLVLWRFTSVVTCELNQSSTVWNILTCSILLGVSLLILFGLARRVPRLAIVSSLLIGSGIVVADIGLRGWWGINGGRSAQHLMPLQLLWILHAIAVLFHLERTSPTIAVTSHRSADSKRTPTISKQRPVVELIDSLARREGIQSPPRSGTQSDRGRERSHMRF